MPLRSRLERHDVGLAKAASSARETWTVRLLGGLSEIADQPPMIALSAATLLIGLWRRDRRLADTGGRMLGAELIATLIKGAVKANVDRTRPYLVAAGMPHRFGPGSRDESGWSSFPSGHTAGAVAVARAVGRDYPAALPALATAAVGVALVQLPRGKHYPVDILAGAAIGMVAEGIVSAAERRLVRATR